MVRSAMFSLLIFEDVDPDTLKQLKMSEDKTDHLIEKLFIAFAELSDQRNTYLEHIAGTLANSIKKGISEFKPMPKRESLTISPQAHKQTDELETLRSSLDQISHQLDQIVRNYVPLKYQSQRTTLHGSISDNGSISEDSYFSISGHTSMTSVDYGPVLRSDRTHGISEQESWRVRSIKDKSDSIERQLVEQKKSLEEITLSYQREKYNHLQTMEKFQELIAKDKVREVEIETRLRNIRVGNNKDSHFLEKMKDIKKVALEEAQEEIKQIMAAYSQSSEIPFHSSQKTIQLLMQQKLYSEAKGEATKLDRQEDLEIHPKLYKPQGWEVEVYLLEKDLKQLEEEKTIYQRRLDDSQNNLKKTEHILEQKSEAMMYREKQIEELQTLLKSQSSLTRGDQTVLDAELVKLRSTFQAAQSMFTQQESAYMLQSASLEAELGYLQKEYDRLTRNLIDFRYERRKHEEEVDKLKKEIRVKDRTIVDGRIKQLENEESKDVHQEFRKIIQHTKLDHEKERE
ncbi:hypothetical protein BDF14DRAFT_1745954 [Spinellus fusiger]|nr:hypothetical protein BDF14DRAFT_1745954 [Spinellus fusiger]